MFGMASLAAEDLGLQGMILLGSSASVPDNLPWQRPLFDWIWARVEQGIPLLAICYGHQLVAHMLGGKVEYIDPVTLNKQTGTRQITLIPPPFAPSLKSGAMVVSHREIVTKLPDSMTVFARSTSYQYDGLVHKHLPVWTLQPHPEATRQFLRAQSIELPEDPKLFQFGHEFVKGFITYCFQSRPTL
jgi:GMP synthase (glutamine-hydrolysing)